jgi:regulator of nonsense transcripts 1
MASGMMNGRNGHRNDYREGSSIAGYIPDDVSSIHSSAIGGVGVPAGYPPMFQGFTPDSWPTLNNNGHRANGGKGRAVPGSVAGESTVPTESDVTGSGIGGVSLEHLSMQDSHKQTSYNQSDRLKRYVENAPGGFRASSVIRFGKPAGEDEDARSVSTAFASQIGGGYD